MGKKYNFRRSIKHYTYQEMLHQHSVIKRRFPSAECKIKMGIGCVYLRLRPTQQSVEYKIWIDSKVGEKTVRIFVIDPEIIKECDGKDPPHRYSDGSLCLYYPPKNEWNYKDLWAETLIPWASLWLYYYEIWNETGEWLGGGIHGNPKL